MDANDVPIGTVLPFLPDRVPEGWVEWRGQVITRGEYPELVELLNLIRESHEAFGLIGGVVGNVSVKLPCLTREEAWRAFGMPNMGEIVVAQRAFRTVNSDAADTEASEVRDDDSEDGQPRQ